MHLEIFLHIRFVGTLCSNLLFILFFPGMKVYVTDEKELIMEPSIKWAGNPNITVAVKAFGLKATAQVIDCSAVKKNVFIWFIYILY